MRFGLWAPALEFVDLLIEGEIELLRLQRSDDGWHVLTTPRARAGSRYWYILPDGTRVADPASSFQPEGVNGPSEVVDHSAYRWRDSRWKGLPWHTAVIYQLQAGTYSGACEELRSLVRLGITAVQLTANASEHTFGTPDDFKAFVDEAHGFGIMVLLDVVYDRLPWGVGPDFEGENSRPLRDFVVGSAIVSLEKYHLDGLRLRAAPKGILVELAQVVRARITQRQVHLILEEEVRQPALLERSCYGDIPLYNAQWSECGESLESSAPLPPDTIVSPLRNPEVEPEFRAELARRLLMPQIPMLFMRTEHAQQESDSLEGRRWRERYGWLLELRHREIIPRIPSIEGSAVVRRPAPAVVEVVWNVGGVEELILIANLSDAFVDVPVPRGRVLWLEGARGNHGGLHAWSLLWIVRPVL